MGYMYIKEKKLRGVNLNYRSRAVAKGLLRTIFCGMLF